MSQVDQQTIVAWFDSVYRRKGTRYLRPVRAYLVFLELLGVAPEHRLLDVACGPGMLLQAARRYTPYRHGIDVSGVALEQAKQHAAGAFVALANAERLPFRDKTFDIVTCLGSLERMLNVSQGLEEMRRVGKPGARYCFLVRNSNTLAWRCFGRLLGKQRRQGHAGADSLESWRSLFEAQGFRVVDVWPDQYPLHRRRRWLSLGLKPVDFSEPVRRNRPLDRANEFVFVLDRRC
jgi:SAM-dependent methyltransferase